MKEYSEASLIEASRNIKGLKKKALKNHLKDRTHKHSTSVCYYCNSYARDIGILVSPIPD